MTNDFAFVLNELGFTATKVNLNTGLCAPLDDDDSPATPWRPGEGDLAHVPPALTSIESLKRGREDLLVRLKCWANNIRVFYDDDDETVLLTANPGRNNLMTHIVDQYIYRFFDSVALLDTNRNSYTLVFNHHSAGPQPADLCDDYNREIVDFCRRVVALEDQPTFIERARLSFVKAELERKSVHSLLFGMIDPVRGYTRKCLDYRWYDRERGLVLVSRADITATYHAEKHRENEMQALLLRATTDGLTGVCNRDTFALRVNEALKSNHRTRGGLLFIDLDQFKPINDRYGHVTGNSVLKRIAAVIKRFETPTTFVGRVGGDEFALYHARPHGTDDLTQLATEICEAVAAEQIWIEGERVHVTVSIGIAMTYDGLTDYASLYAKADTAAYLAKNHGRGRWELFDEKRALSAPREHLRAGVAEPNAVVESKSRDWFVSTAQEILKTRQGVLVSIDVCDFKLVNLLFGREAGNRLLTFIYRTIEDALTEGELVVHDTADIFYVLLHTRDKATLLGRLNAIRGRIGAVVLDDSTHSPHMELRAGIYVPEDEADVGIERMIEYANLARKQTSGRYVFDDHCFYDGSRTAVKVEEKALMTALITALDEGQFDIYLQPKISLVEGKVAGAEALVRWNHPERGIVLPGKFIPILEKFRLIHRVDMTVFDLVCRMLSRWRSEGLPAMPISLNLSRQSLEIPYLLSHLTRICTRYDVPTSWIELEITETSLLSNLELMKSFIESARAEGFRCSIDDFGSGYSSLGSLHDLTVDAVKFDRSFFRHTDSARSWLIIAAMMNLAKTLGCQTVAEGIETPKQLTQLECCSCDQVQGYVHHRPMPVADFEALAFASADD